MTTATRCRALVAGFGRPGMRDLDFGRQLVRYLEGLTWPEGVVVEDLSYAAPLVLHRLRELDPAKVVLVGAVARGFDPPGALRRYRVDPAPPPPDDVRRSLEESVQGVVDLDNTLAVARHWGGLPAETVVVEVEPADCSFGLGFSEELAAAFDSILALVHEELGDAGGEWAELDVTGDPSSLTVEPALVDVPPSAALTDLVQYADTHRQVRNVERHRGTFLTAPGLDLGGLEVAGCSRPWGANVGAGADWFDVIPLGDSWLGLAIGDVGGRGCEAAAAMADLRAALRAYALLDGEHPGRVIGHLDRLVRANHSGEDATVVFIAVRASTGELRLSNAGHCPPLLVAAGDGSRFVYDARSAPLGRASAARRPEATLRLSPGSSVVLFTDGLLRDQDDDFDRLRQIACESTGSVEELCALVVDACTTGSRRNDDISLLAFRMP